jgi:hypothetical protein
MLPSIFLCLALVIVPGAASAQEDVAEEAPVFDLFQSTGVTELQLQGTLLLALDDDKANNAGLAQGSYGWFFTERQEVGGSATVIVFDDPGGDLDFAGSAGPFYRFNFQSGEIMPYVGAALAATFGDFTQGDVQLQLEGGARFFVDRSTAFTVAGTLNYDVDANDFSDVLNVFFGFSHFWE